MKVVIIVSIILIAILGCCILWACLDAAGRDGQYYKCDVIVTYHYNHPMNRDDCYWKDESKEILIVEAYRTDSPPVGVEDEFIAHVYDAIVLETKEDIIWAE